MATKDAVKIRILKDGPYEVSHDVPLVKENMVCDDEGVSNEWDAEKKYDTGKAANYHLCRCGHSRNKPFCDGAHEAAGFCGHETADRPTYHENARRLKGRGLDLLDDETLCVGARFCDKGSTIWRDVGHADDRETADRVIKEACNCPGGRLTAMKKDGTPIEPKLPKEIDLVNDTANDMRGPLWVKGGIPIEGANGEQYETRNRVALCRCGESSNMPYCDGSHYHCAHMQGQDE